MKKFIEQEAALKLMNELKEYKTLDFNDAIEIVATQPAADVVEVRQIQAFIDRLVAERDKYDLHSMCWEHYNCDRLLIEQMLDEMDGGVNDG